MTLDRHQKHETERLVKKVMDEYLEEKMDDIEDIINDFEDGQDRSKTKKLEKRIKKLEEKAEAQEKELKELRRLKEIILLLSETFSKSVKKESPQIAIGDFKNFFEMLNMFNRFKIGSSDD